MLEFYYGNSGQSGEHRHRGRVQQRRRILENRELLKHLYSGKEGTLSVETGGNVGQTVAMLKVHPDVLRSGDAAQIQAAEALVKAITMPEWGYKNLTRNRKMTDHLIAQLNAQRQHSEVSDFLNRLQNDSTRVDSRELHYIQRRYLDGRPFKNVEDMDALYQRIIQDPDAQIYQAGGRRYQVRSVREGWIAIVEPDGTRVSVYPDLEDDFGEPLWNRKNLML